MRHTTTEVTTRWTTSGGCARTPSRPERRTATRSTSGSQVAEVAVAEIVRPARPVVVEVVSRSSSGPGLPGSEAARRVEVTEIGVEAQVRGAASDFAAAG